MENIATPLYTTLKVHLVQMGLVLPPCFFQAQIQISVVTSNET